MNSKLGVLKYKVVAFDEIFPISHCMFTSKVIWTLLVLIIDSQIISLIFKPFFFYRNF